MLFYLFFLEAEICVRIVREFFLKNRHNSLFSVRQTKSGCEKYFRLKNGIAWSDDFLLLIYSDINMNHYEVLLISLCFMCWVFLFSP